MAAPADPKQDLIVTGGTVVDGTGVAGQRLDVRIRSGRIVEVGSDLEPAGEQRIDASGALVTPGFIDVHTHLDAQIFWDPTCDPQPQHGVTTALIGNCSLTLFPLAGDHQGIVDMFSFIEDVPDFALENGVPWGWQDYTGYRDAVNAGGTALNVASLVGHSPLRLAAMGEDGWDRAATADERAAMAELLRAAMDSGAWGLSTSFFDQDRHGRPVPSRLADDDEIVALLDVIAAAGRGLVEFVPELRGEGVEAGFRRLGEPCGARGIPLSWTGFTSMNQFPGRTEALLDMTTRMRAEGIPIYPQLSPRTVDLRVNWDSSMMFMRFPEGWNRVIAARGADKAALLRDPAWRDKARWEWDTIEQGFVPVNDLTRIRIVEVINPDDEGWLGGTLADIVDARGGHPSDVLADFVLDNDCRPGVVSVGVANGEPEKVAELFGQDGVLIGSSDAGAHVQMMCSSGDTTLLLTRHVRDRGDMTLERAVWELTGRPAEVFGFGERGVIAEGRAGDLAVFALDELHWDADVLAKDLPGGASRLRRPEGGYRCTVINGVVVQRDGELTGALPGRMLDARAEADGRRGVG